MLPAKLSQVAESGDKNHGGDPRRRQGGVRAFALSGPSLELTAEVV